MSAWPAVVGLLGLLAFVVVVLWAVARVEIARLDAVGRSRRGGEG